MGALCSAAALCSTVAQRCTEVEQDGAGKSGRVWCELANGRGHGRPRGSEVLQSVGHDELQIFQRLKELILPQNYDQNTNFDSLKLPNQREFAKTTLI